MSTTLRSNFEPGSERLGVPALPAARGYLSIYQRSVQAMSTGAVLVERG